MFSFLNSKENIRHILSVAFKSLEVVYYRIFRYAGCAVFLHFSKCFMVNLGLIVTPTFHQSSDTKADILKELSYLRAGWGENILWCKWFRFILFHIAPVTHGAFKKLNQYEMETFHNHPEGPTMEPQREMSDSAIAAWIKGQVSKAFFTTRLILDCSHC